MKYHLVEAKRYCSAVAPLAGAWIEIEKIINVNKAVELSLPSRERGLKSRLRRAVADRLQVAPLAGAWIEILFQHEIHQKRDVAPLAGAWIEIISKPQNGRHMRRSPRGSVD